MILREGERILVKGSVTVDEIRKELRAGLTEIEGGASVVDLGELANADSTAIAMFLEWMRASNRAGRRLSFVNIPRELESLIGLYGLNPVFAGQ
ncbi:MAG: STAS domain-containing protein [Burkholderiales bacterium]|nr:STAS domain-containing protein [Burkholderiales bacterium]